MIGFYDLDFYDDKKLNWPNLELMKLASYHQKEEQQFCRLILPGEEELDSYDKIYVFSEQEEHKPVPLAFKRANNIIYGGSGFTRGKYIPFENKLIDYSLPSIQMYKNYLSKFFEIGMSYKTINSFLDTCYYRMYAGENKLPIPKMIKNKKIIIYDREIFYDDWLDIFEQLSKRNPSTILTIHPIYCNTLTEFFSLRRYPKFSPSNELILNLDVPFSQFNALFKRYELKFRADIGLKSAVMLPIGGTYFTKFQYYENFNYIMNLLFGFWAHNIPIKLYYQKPKTGIYNPIEDLTKHIVNWASLSTEKKQKETLLDRITKKSDNEKQKDELIKYNRNLSRLFNQSYEKLSNQGYWMV